MGKFIGWSYYTFPICCPTTTSTHLPSVTYLEAGVSWVCSKHVPIFLLFSDSEASSKTTVFKNRKSSAPNGVVLGLIAETALSVVLTRPLICTHEGTSYDHSFNFIHPFIHSFIHSFIHFFPCRTKVQIWADAVLPKHFTVWRRKTHPWCTYIMVHKAEENPKLFWVFS